MSSKSILAWAIYILFAVRLALGEEDETVVYVQPDDNLDKLWRRFPAASKYSLYCVVLAYSSDEQVASLVQAHRPELAEISGQSCCFIYFRDLDKAKVLAPYQFSEHARWVYPLAQFVGLAQSELPCRLANSKNPRPITVLKRFKQAMAWQVKRQQLLENAAHLGSEIGKDVLAALIGAMVPSH